MSTVTDAGLAAVCVLALACLVSVLLGVAIGWLLSERRPGRSAANETIETLAHTTQRLTNAVICRDDIDATMRRIEAEAEVEKAQAGQADSPPGPVGNPFQPPRGPRDPRDRLVPIPD